MSCQSVKINISQGMDEIYQTAFCQFDVIRLASLSRSRGFRAWLLDMSFLEEAIDWLLSIRLHIHPPNQGGRLWVVSFSLLAPSYFWVLFLLPGELLCTSLLQGTSSVSWACWRWELKNHGANSSTSNAV